MNRLPLVVLAVPALLLARLLPATGVGLGLRLAAATACLLVPGALISRALRLRGLAPAFAWSLAALIGALALTFALHRSLWLTVVALAAVSAAALPFAFGRQPPRESSVGFAVLGAGIAFGTFFTPGMTLLSNVAEERGLQFGYSSSLLNLAWAPGQALGAAGSGALAHATGDVVPYLALSAICALTLVGLWRSHGSTSWTMRSVPASSGSSSRITGDA